MLEEHVRLNYRGDNTWINTIVKDNQIYLEIDDKLIERDNGWLVYNNLKLTDIQDFKLSLSPDDPKGEHVFPLFCDMIEAGKINIRSYGWILFEGQLFINKSAPSHKNGLKVWFKKEPFLPGMKRRNCCIIS